ncbi:MAG: YceI family protein [Bacteroidia bacterium]|nr:YceI family protein [Bacteroidia bacterium]
MKKLLFTGLIIAMIGLFFIPARVFSQKYILGQGSVCSVKGSSTLHDWNVTIGKVSGEITLDKSFTKKASPAKGAVIAAGNISFEVKSMDGGRGAVMNDKIYNAFQSEKNPNVVFTLVKATVTEVKTDGSFTLNATGNLTMAGNTQSISFPLTGKKGTDGRYNFTGEKSLDMTTYGMEPPSAMFGQIETGKDVTLIFNLFFGA